MQDLTGMVVVSSLMLAAVLGFVAHRASVCTVKAVAEVVSTGQGYMFLSFFKTVLWVMAITIPFMWWLPEAHGAQRSWGISTTVLLGGFLFGMGATLNKGCAFSTLSRLGDGQLSMLVTLAGFGTGIYVYARLSDAYTLPHTTLEPALTGRFVLKEVRMISVGFEVDDAGAVTKAVFYQPTGVYDAPRVEE